MSSYYKGFAVIKNAKGTVKVAARATVVNALNSAAVTDISPVEMHMDSNGIPRTRTRDYKGKEVTLELTPGVGASIAVGSVDELVDLPEKGDAIVLSDFELSSLNWAETDKAIIWEASSTVAMGQLGTLRVTARKFTDNAGTVIDFSTTPIGGWATL